MGPYGRKTSNDILSENTQEICSQNFRYTPRNGLYQSSIKNREISKFTFVTFLLLLLLLLLLMMFFLGAFNMGVNGMMKRAIS